MVFCISPAISYTVNAEKAEETINEIKQSNVDALAIQADSSDVAQIEYLVSQIIQHAKLRYLCDQTAAHGLFNGAINDIIQITCSIVDRALAHCAVPLH